MVRKLLCLHGYTQNGPLLSKKMGALRKQLIKHEIECFFPTGPHTLIKSSIISDDEKSWWNSINNNTEYLGLNESIENLVLYAFEHGPFDGVFGFSQGSVMAAIIASMIKPQYLILVSGFLPRDQNALKMITFAGPTLHVIGLNDVLVLPEYSRSLYNSMIQNKNSSVLEHDGGHLIPGKSEYRNSIVNWILTNSINQKL
jgi:esterase/lipase